MTFAETFPLPEPRLIIFTTSAVKMAWVASIDDESCSRSREKLYKLVNRLIRAYA